MLLKRVIFSALSVFLLCLSSVPAANAEEKTAAMFRFEKAGGVDMATLRRVDSFAQRAVREFGYQLVSRQAISDKLGKNDPTVQQLCESSDLSCYARITDVLGVSVLFIGVVEKVGDKTAIDIRSFIRDRKARKDDPPGKIDEQIVDYYFFEAKEPLYQVTERIIARILSDFGYLKVSTNANGANIILNGESYGTFPLKTPLRLPVGKYKAKLTKEGYVDFEGEFAIKVEETTLLKGALKPLPFSLNIESTPSNAAVFLGETSLGYTPIKDYKILTFEKLPLKIETDEYFDHVEQLDVIPGQKITKKVTLKPKFGDVLINSKALDIKVFIDGKFVGNTPLKTLPRIGMGPHKVELKHPDYLPFAQTIKIEPGIRNVFSLNPTAKYARLRVATNVDRARVYIDDKFVGFSPVDDFVRIPAGRYTMKVTKHNYFDYETPITLTPGKDLTFSASLNTQLGKFKLDSNITGAKVYLNDRYLGETPLKQIDNIVQGEYELILVKKPFFDYTEKIAIKPGRVNNHYAEMITTLAKLKVESNARGAKIFLGKRYLGTTPADIFTGLKPGKNELIVTLDGYKPYRSAIELTSNNVLTVNANLERKQGVIIVRSEPVGASVRLNDSTIGVTPLNIQQPTGQYDLKVVHKGYRDYGTKVSISTEKPVRVQAKLSPKPYLLYIDSSERGAQVTVNGVLIGSTPVSGYKGSDFGVRTLKITKVGFKPIVKKVRLEPGKKYKLNAPMTPASASFKP